MGLNQQVAVQGANSEGKGLLTNNQESGREREALRDVAAHLADFLIQQIEEVQTEWPDAPRRKINCAEKKAKMPVL